MSLETRWWWVFFATVAKLLKATQKHFPKTFENANNIDFCEMNCESRITKIWEENLEQN